MQLLKSLFLATAAASTAFAISSGMEAGIQGATDASTLGFRFKRRGPIHDAIGIIQKKKKVGSDFCSTFLHVPPYAATKTITKTSTLTKQVAVSTSAVKTALTHTLTPVKRTEYATGVGVESPISAVSDMTSAVTQTRTATSTAVVSPGTNVIPRHAALPHDASRTRLPHWMNQYSCPQVSQACSHVVMPKTKTVTKTIFATVTVGTPTKTSIISVSSTSTSTAATVTARIVLNKTSNGTFYGYIGQGTHYGFHEARQNVEDALTVQFPGDLLTTGGPVNFAISGSFPNLGAIAGDPDSNSDLSSSNFNYLYMASTNAVPARSQSSDTTGTAFSSYDYNAKYESEIWKLDLTANLLTIDWTNSDGQVFSSPSLYYATTSNSLGWTGNLALLRDQFPEETFIGLTATLQTVS
ncbi:hypothetical protein OC846_005809 [Tilletia horrida]|uniref:Peptidase A1 domain-containing protein n=1 Tax=Tilletia horrida TaxID=155126 RepID=A0AAN6GMA2_9BASI|nr:hypothetical protein OC845_005903 [Tilletia horrida]KAK0545071.1 hypothetical protein OC846_005809 [Tilletia horrida]KAK0561169.1 hypothetical protein OC861_005953 [Tilletia horrida]